MIPATRGGAPAKDATLGAIGLAVLATVFFSMGDVIAKVLTGTLPAIEVAWLRYSVFCLVVVPTAFGARGLQAMRTRNPASPDYPGAGGCWLDRPVLFRTEIPASGRGDSNLVYLADLHYCPLDSAARGDGGHPALGGRSGGLLRCDARCPARRLGLSVAALLPICAALGGAVTAITTRQLSSEGPETTLAWTAVVGLVTLTVFVPFNWHMPTTGEIGLAVLMGAFSTVGHWLTILAYRKAAASTIAPFTYIQLVFAGLLGFAVFGTIPGAMTLVGGLIIAASGLYTAHREHVRAREAKLTSAGSRQP